MFPQWIFRLFQNKLLILFSHWMLWRNKIQNRYFTSKHLICDTKFDMWHLTTKPVNNKSMLCLSWIFLNNVQPCRSRIPIIPVTWQHKAKVVIQFLIISLRSCPIQQASWEIDRMVLAIVMIASDHVHHSLTVFFISYAWKGYNWLSCVR